MTTTSAPQPYHRTLGPDTAEWYLDAHLFTWLAESTDTGGLFSLAQVTLRAGAEPPPHTHSDDDEGWYVLDGELTFWVGGREIQARKGDWVYTPRGLQHAFAVHGETATVLMLVTPGGAEDVFHAMSRPAPEVRLPDAPTGPPPPEAIEAMLAAFATKGVEFAIPA